MGAGGRKEKERERGKKHGCENDINWLPPASPLTGAGGQTCSPSACPLLDIEPIILHVWTDALIIEQHGQGHSCVIFTSVLYYC